MGKFFNKEKKKAMKYTPEQMIKMAEDHLNNKINEMADFLEQKKWNNQDTATVFNIILENDIYPKFKTKDKKKLKETMEVLTITKEGK